MKSITFVTPHLTVFTGGSKFIQDYSNEFSKKSAKERKQIISSILGLAQYEQLKKRAIEKAQELSAQKKYMLDQQ